MNKLLLGLITLAFIYTGANAKWDPQMVDILKGQCMKSGSAKYCNCAMKYHQQNFNSFKEMMDTEQNKLQGYMNQIAFRCTIETRGQ
jgi:hypothetical protein